MKKRINIRVSQQLYLAVKHAASSLRKTMSRLVAELVFAVLSPESRDSLIELRKSLGVNIKQFDCRGESSCLPIRISQEIGELLDKAHFAYGNRNDKIRHILNSFFDPAFPVWTLRHFQFSKKVHNSNADKVEILVLEGGAEQKQIYKKEMKMFGVRVEEALFGEGNDILHMQASLTETALEHAAKLGVEVFLCPSERERD